MFVLYICLCATAWGAQPENDTHEYKGSFHGHFLFDTGNINNSFTIYDCGSFKWQSDEGVAILRDLCGIFTFIEPYGRYCTESLMADALIYKGQYAAGRFNESADCIHVHNTEFTFQTVGSCSLPPKCGTPIMHPEIKHWYGDVYVCMGYHSYDSKLVDYYEINTEYFDHKILTWREAELEFWRVGSSFESVYIIHRDNMWGITPRLCVEHALTYIDGELQLPDIFYHKGDQLIMHTHPMPANICEPIMFYSEFLAVDLIPELFVYKWRDIVSDTNATMWTWVPKSSIVLQEERIRFSETTVCFATPEEWIYNPYCHGTCYDRPYQPTNITFPYHTISKGVGSGIASAIAEGFMFLVKPLLTALINILAVLLEMFLDVAQDILDVFFDKMDIIVSLIRRIVQLLAKIVLRFLTQPILYLPLGMFLMMFYYWDYRLGLSALVAVSVELLYITLID